MLSKQRAEVIQQFIHQDNIPKARHLAEQWVNDCPNELLALQYAVMTQLFDGDAKAAEQSCLAACVLDPALPRNQANLAIAQMTLGNLTEGLRLYESRYAKGMLAHDKVIFEGLPYIKQWQGQPLEGKRILLAGEQGFGDQIQFIRFASNLRKLGAKYIVAHIRPELHSLMLSMTELDEVITVLPDPDDYDYWCPLLSIPLQLKLSSIPAPSTIPYLHANSNRVIFWNKQFSEWFCKHLKIGIVWAGTPGNSIDGRRSLKIQDMFQLLEAKGETAFISLQLGNAGMVLLNEQCARGMVPLLDMLIDFNETAAVIQNLDLVISVDTAVAHLAGALGKDVWLLLPKGPDWRWGLDGVTTPWYPSMRIFRQPTSGDWQTVIQNVCHELKQRYSNKAFM